MAKKTKAAPAAKIETHKIESREQWLALRKAHVTASAAGALLGVHDYVTPYGLFLEKRGEAEEISESAPMRRGRYMEPVALAILREEYPEIRFEQPGVYLCDPVARIGATPDIYAHCPKRGLGVVQVKSVAEPVFKAKWHGGEDFEEVTPPLWVNVQAIVEAHLSGAKWAAVAPIVVGFGIECPLIEIPLTGGAQRVMANLKSRVVDFWQKVEANEPPEFDYARDGEAIAALYGLSNGQTLDLSADNRMPALLDELLAAKADKKSAAEREDVAKNEIRVKLGNYEAAYVPGYSLSYKTQSRAAYTVAAGSMRVLRASRKG